MKDVKENTRGVGGNKKSGSVVGWALLGIGVRLSSLLSVCVLASFERALGTIVLPGDMADDDDVAEDWEDADTEVWQYLLASYSFTLLE